MRTAAKVLGEFCLIVVGVLVALMADDFRQELETRDSAHAAAALLIADLERDSVQLAEVLAQNPGKRWASALLLSDSVGLPQHEVEDALHNLLLGSPYNPVRATFDLLVQQDRLRHIGDDSLQSEIVQYYEVRQENVVEWSDGWVEAYFAYTEQFARYTSPRTRPGQDPLESWFSNIQNHLTAPWSEIQRDNVFMNSLFFRQTMGQLYGRSAANALDANNLLRRRLGELTEPGE